MEKVEIFLQETGPQSDKKMRLILGISGFFYLLFGILLNYGHKTFYNYVLLIGGILIIAYMLGYKKFVKRCFIFIDDNGIRANLYTLNQIFTKGLIFSSPYKKINITWGQIESAEIKPLKIIFNLNDGKQEELELGDLLYKQHQILKPKLQDYLQEKNIKIQ